MVNIPYIYIYIPYMHGACGYCNLVFDKFVTYELSSQSPFCPVGKCSPVAKGSCRALPRDHGYFQNTSMKVEPLTCKVFTLWSFPQPEPEGKTENDHTGSYPWGPAMRCTSTTPFVRDFPVVLLLWNTYESFMLGLPGERWWWWKCPCSSFPNRTSLAVQSPW